MIRRRYKVVKACMYIPGNIYWSAVVPKPASIDYEIGKWVQPNPIFSKKGYYLTVFKKLKHAIKFIEGLVPTVFDYQIFECKVKGKHVSYRKLPPRFKNVQYSGFIPIINGSSLELKFPKGTEMWEYVKLIKKVEW